MISVVFCLAENHYLLTVAAFNVHKTPGWVEKHTAGMDVCVMDMSAGTTCIEIQGPKSRQIMQKIADFDCSNAALPYYRFVTCKIADIEVMVARMGVTGELGYEIFYDPGYAWQMYDASVKAGQGEGMELCGNRTIGMFPALKKSIMSTRATSTNRPILTRPALAGRSSWTKAISSGARCSPRSWQTVRSRKLVGYVASDLPVNVAPKSPIKVGSEPVGHVTIVGFSPTLKKAIGLGYVKPAHAAIGSQLTLQSDSGMLSATIVETPFFDPKGTRLRG